MAAEIARDNRRQRRNRAFNFMSDVRDRGWTQLGELRGNEVVMVWGVKDELSNDNKFKLLVNGTELILDAEEVRKWIRWV